MARHPKLHHQKMESTLIQLKLLRGLGYFGKAEDMTSVFLNYACSLKIYLDTIMRFDITSAAYHANHTEISYVAERG